VLVAATMPQIKANVRIAPPMVFTLKVSDLQGTLPANTQWKVYSTSPNATVYWVSMLTDGNSAVSYAYGTTANSVDTTIGNLDAGSFTADGTITLTIANSKVGNPATGQSLTAIFGETYMLVGVLLTEIDGTSNGSYTLIGSAACSDGNPQPGDLLGAVNGRTFTGDNDQTRTRPSDSNWYIIGSSTDSTLLRNLGLSGDVPIPSAFIY
jgi:hypothetical protein